METGFYFGCFLRVELIELSGELGGCGVGGRAWLRATLGIGLRIG